jgi:hypothetical protein
MLRLKGGSHSEDAHMGGTDAHASDPAKVKVAKLCEEAWMAQGEGEVQEAERLYHAALREVTGFSNVVSWKLVAICFSEGKKKSPRSESRFIAARENT